MLSIITLLPTTPVLLRVESPERMVGGSSRLILVEECRGGEGLLVLIMMMMMGILLVMLLTTRARLKYSRVHIDQVTFTPLSK